DRAHILQLLPASSVSPRVVGAVCAPPFGRSVLASGIWVACKRHRRYVAGETLTVQAYCQRYTRTLPDRFPVHPRGDMATFRPPVVARRDGEELLCDCQHEGAHIWPDGEPAARGGVAGDDKTVL